MATDHRNKDQQRKATLKQREKRRRPIQTLTPYEGRKYQQPAWQSHLYETELAIYETIMLSRESLTNDEVKQALLLLIQLLLADESATPIPGEPIIPYAPTGHVEYLIGNIREHWQILFDRLGPVARHDLIGILRTLLFSIEAHGAMGDGYVHFLKNFLGHADDGELRRIVFLDTEF